MYNYLINVLTRGVFNTGVTIYAEMINGKFLPESLACVIPTGGDIPRNEENGLDMVGMVARFGSAVEVTDAMRDFLDLDFDPEINPEDGDFAQNYPSNNVAFAKALLRDAAVSAIRDRNRLEAA